MVLKVSDIKENIDSKYLECQLWCIFLRRPFPASNYLFKVNNGNTGTTKLVRGIIAPSFSKISPFLEIQDVPTFYRHTGKTNGLIESSNRLLYKFYPQSILILEEYLLQWGNANLI